MNKHPYPLIETDFYRGPVPFDPDWRPVGGERYARVFAHQHEAYAQAIEAARAHWVLA